MWILPLLVAGSLAGSLQAPAQAVPVQSSLPQACFVFGEIFWSAYQTNAMLSSNCPIKIERRERLLVLKGPQRIVKIVIPELQGLHEFIYRWGSDFARFDDDKVDIAGRTD